MRWVWGGYIRGWSVGDGRVLDSGCARGNAEGESVAFFDNGGQVWELL